MNKFRNIIYQVLKFILVLPCVNLVRIMKIFAYDFGYLRSAFTYQSIDRDGNPIPWFSYSAIEYLDSLDLSKKDVFEFGTGNSTVYWAKNARSVAGIENNESWLSYVKNQTLKFKNVKLTFEKNKNQYANALSKLKRKFDIIIIDGENRQECVNIAIKQLKRGGLIILDNSDWYPKTCRSLHNIGFTEINFSGFGPINPYCTTTSFFILKSLDFKHNAKHFSPKNHIGAIR